MKRDELVLAGLLSLAMLAGQAGRAAGEIAVATGCSEAKDAAQAGQEAAQKAKAALKGAAAKVVLVFDSVGGGAAARQKVLDAAAKEFDASIVYGCSAYNAITIETVNASVGVLALGGDVQVEASMAPLEKDANGKDDYEACGRKIAEGLKDAAAKAKDAGKLLVLIGDCHVPSDDLLTKGVCSVLGEKFPVGGGAAMGGLTYCKGKVVPRSNLGLLIWGDFKISPSLMNSPSKDATDQVNVAGEAFKKAVAGDKDKLIMVFAFECGGRRGQMGAERPKELDLMKAVSGTAPIFGFYGSGEIGRKDGESAPMGVGFHISVCAMSRN
jgi:hypothetical protein